MISPPIPPFCAEGDGEGVAIVAQAVLRWRRMMSASCSRALWFSLNPDPHESLPRRSSGPSSGCFQRTVTDSMPLPRSTGGDTSLESGSHDSQADRSRSPGARN